jgi:exodeoxyribonuclease III
MDTELSVMTLNIANPSRARAEKQLDWLASRPEQILVLTETSANEGSRLVAERLGNAGWRVQYSVPPQGERGVMLATRVAGELATEELPIYLPDRAATMLVSGVQIIGVYAPSRDASVEKVARKRRFLAELLTLIGQRPGGKQMVIGDLNIVEPGSRGVTGLFQDWEFEFYEELPSMQWADAFRQLHPDRGADSWVDPNGVGFRFDHCFLSAGLTERLVRCEYVHETRTDGLSDHSALSVAVAVDSLTHLDVSDALDGSPPSLF